MSFGVSVGDFVAVGKLCWATTLYLILKEIESEAQDPNSILNRHGQGQFAYLYTAISNLRPTLQELEGLATKYRGLGKMEKRTWDRVKFATEGVDSLRGKLSYHITAIGVLRSSISSSAIVRIEGILEDIKRDMQLGKRPTTILSTSTESSQGSTSSRKELEVELIEEGISQTDIDSNWEAIVSYLEDPRPNIGSGKTTCHFIEGYMEESGSASQTRSIVDDGDECWDSVSQRSISHPVTPMPLSLPASGSLKNLSSNHSQAIDIKRIVCDCTPRPSVFMETRCLLAGLREGDIVMQIPCYSTTKRWVLGVTRQGYLGYFCRDWMRNLTEPEIAAIQSHPLDKFRSKAVQDSHEQSFPGCSSIRVFIAEIPAILRIPHLSATYWDYDKRYCTSPIDTKFLLVTYDGRLVEVHKVTGDPVAWFSDHPVPACIQFISSSYDRSESEKVNALGNLARRYLEIRVQEEPTGYLQTLICHIYFRTLSQGAIHQKDFFNNVLASSLNRPGVRLFEPQCQPYFQSPPNKISQDYILNLFPSNSKLEKGSHSVETKTRLACYAKLDVSFKDTSSVTTDTSKGSASSSVKKSSHILPLEMSLEPLTGSDIPVIGKKFMGVRFGRGEKALAKDFELIKTCIDNFLLAEYKYDAATAAFVSLQDACNLVNGRNRQMALRTPV
ncbi:hypothetical protein FQN49_003306 [Arthroderma sp. PD_2]|nr:hypothetical protein FQN49_003306 [Arthroderma sp. PD_2]